MKTEIARGLRMLRDAKDEVRLERLLDVFEGCGRQILDSIDDETMTQYCGRERGRIVSFLSIRDRGTPRGDTRVLSNMIYNVCTDPRRRGRGLMKILLARLMEDCRAQKRRRLHLEVFKNNIPAIRLYETMGFQYLRDAGEERKDSIVMRLTLSSCPWRGVKTEGAGLPPSGECGRRARRNCGREEN